MPGIKLPLGSNVYPLDNQLLSVTVLLKFYASRRKVFRLCLEIVVVDVLLNKLFV